MGSSGVLRNIFIWLWLRVDWGQIIRLIFLHPNYWLLLAIIGYYCYYWVAKSITIIGYYWTTPISLIIGIIRNLLLLLIFLDPNYCNYLFLLQLLRLNAIIVINHIIAIKCIIDYYCQLLQLILKLTIQ